MRVLSVSRSPAHGFSKPAREQIHLLVGLGVEGDAHCGRTVKHRYRVAKDPAQPNFRQVHLMHSELLEELADKGFAVSPGQLGENITTCGIDLLSLPADAELAIGSSAVVRITGLRNPCRQIEAFQPHLLAAVLERSAQGRLIRKAGVMGIVMKTGIVRAGDDIRVRLPTTPHRALEPV